MFLTLLRKHLPPLLFLLIGFLMLNSSWKPMLRTMFLLQSYPLLIKIMKFIWLLFTPALLLWWSWITIYITRNCLPSSKLLRFGNTIWKVWPILSTLLWIIKILSIFLLQRYWPRGKSSGPSTSPSSTLLSGSALVILTPNRMLSLDDGTSILKCYGTLNTNNFLFYFLLFFLIWLFFFFILFSWKDNEAGTWQGSHMAGHMMWHHRPRRW